MEEKKPKVDWGSMEKNDPAFYMNKRGVEWDRKHLVNCEQCGKNIRVDEGGLANHKKIWCDKNYKKQIREKTLIDLNVTTDDLAEQKAQLHLRLNKKVLESLQYLAWKKRYTINELVNGVLIEYLEVEQDNLGEGGVP